MTYDAEKNKVLKEYAPIEIGRGEKIVVSLVKYGDGEPKLAIQKMFGKDEKSGMTSKIPRMNYNVLVELNKILKQAEEDLNGL